MKYLIESSYRAIIDGARDLFPSSDILRTAKIMDAILAQIQTGSGSTPLAAEVNIEPGSNYGLAI
jgi:hypothetical protein